METKYWYAVYTRAQRERKVIELLEKEQIKFYCPLNKVVRQWSDRKKTVLEPLFKSYVFVYINKNDYSRIRDIDGIINFVYWLGRPAVIRDVEIDAIKIFLEKHKDVRIEQSQISKSDVVKVLDGAFASMVGEVVELVNHSFVKVFIPSLGFTLVAEARKNNLEVIKLPQQVRANL